jgi:putative membrane protein
MNTWMLLTSAWNWRPDALVSCALLLFGYAAMMRRQQQRRAISLASAVILLLLALVSPIAVLGDAGLLSAHMLQHFILVMLAPPLLLAALPEGLPFARATIHPVPAWIAGVGVMALWHLPIVAQADARYHTFHTFENAFLLGSSLFFWWPVFGPPPAQRLHPVATVGYLATACLCCTAIGAFMAFSPSQIYPAHPHAHDPFGALSFVRSQWGITPKLDQQLAGLLMWVPGCLVYLTAMLTRVAAWYAETETPPLPEPLAVKPLNAAH